MCHVRLSDSSGAQPSRQHQHLKSGWLKPQAKLSRKCWHFNFLGSELVADEAPDLLRSSLDPFASIWKAPTLLLMWNPLLLSGCRHTSGTCSTAWPQEPPYLEPGSLPLNIYDATRLACLPSTGHIPKLRWSTCRNLLFYEIISPPIIAVLAVASEHGWARRH